jgi:hypothetical protein
VPGLEVVKACLWLGRDCATPPPGYRQRPDRLETFIPSLESNWNRVHALDEHEIRFMLYRSKINRADWGERLAPALDHWLARHEARTEPLNDVR